MLGRAKRGAVELFRAAYLNLHHFEMFDAQTAPHVLSVVVGFRV